MVVDKNGEIDFSKKDSHLIFYSSEEVKQRAAVKPISTYFDTPLEMMAESMAHLRDSAQSRRELLENNATLYFESKREDQLDINVTYGLNKLGEPNYIRDLDGHLIPNQPDTRETIALFEERVQRAQKQQQQQQLLLQQQEQPIQEQKQQQKQQQLHHQTTEH